MPDNPENKDTTKVKTKTKRLAKGKRVHVRRMKKVARDEGIVYRPEIK